MTIAIDFDGVIADGTQAKIKWAKHYDGIDITPAECTKATYPAGPDSYRALMDKVTTEHIDDYILTEGARETLERLSEDDDLVVVTSRYDRELKAAARFIRNHDLPITDMYNTNDGPKTDTLRRIGARALIDDTLAKLVPVADEMEDIDLYFFERPWNGHEQIGQELEGRVTPVQSWYQFAESL